MLRPWARQPLSELLAAHGLSDVPEEVFPNDGWSGATLTLLRAGDARYVLKRLSPATDWIGRHTRDRDLREAFVAAGRLRLPESIVAPYLGVAGDGDGAAVLMPDLSAELIAWERAPHEPPLTADALDRVLAGVASLHAVPSHDVEGPPSRAPFPWCPVAERLTLLTPAAADRYRTAGIPAGVRFLAGWERFDARAPGAARALMRALDADVTPLVAALDRLPSVPLHGDLKLANAALLGAGGIALIDWQMATLAPVAVELGWLLVSNVALLPSDPDRVLRAYRSRLEEACATRVALRSAGFPPRAQPGRPGSRRGPVIVAAHAFEDVVGDWQAQVDLAWIVGLLLRGWRKGLDAEARVRFPWGGDGASDLETWSRRAVEAAERRL